MKRAMNTLPFIGLATLLSACGGASGGGDGPHIESVAAGPAIQVTPPSYVIQREGEDLGDGHGGTLAYDDPVVAGVVMERIATEDPLARYRIVQRGGSWGVAHGDDGGGMTLTPADIGVAQGGFSGTAPDAELRAGPATFQIASHGDVQWYLNGAQVGEGGALTIDLTAGYHELSVVIFAQDGSTQSIEVPLSVSPGTISTRLEWTIPASREDGTPLPPEELCCYQVQYVMGNTLNYISVSGGHTSQLDMELEPGFYRFSVVAIDIGGLVSQPSETIEHDLNRPRSA